MTINLIMTLNMCNITNNIFMDTRHVRLKVTLLREPFIANIAPVRFLPRVQAEVRLQVHFAREALTTFGAIERVVAGVLPLVRLQVVFLGEDFVAHAALVAFDARVEFVVHFERSLRGERFPAHATHVRFLTGVEADVFLQLVDGAEQFVTLVAFVLVGAELCGVVWCGGHVVLVVKVVGGSWLIFVVEWLEFHCGNLSGVIFCIAVTVAE